ncbi:PfkB family carbohydrate kinase [Nocardia violaceofusca]|uniref:PfkB family carbohydrate kinase n=1 Tax=Nocardia violaceofusca TaxID=941182 RepID=UPI000A7345DF|nr:PfkB family carbohydrate kinase [Nocardia violaceofusca]
MNQPNSPSPACAPHTPSAEPATGELRKATTLREVSSAHVNDWSSAAWSTETGFVAGPRVYGLHVLDRVGSGDGFAAGLIYGLLAGVSVERALAYGTAHGALVMTTPGDVSMASLAEVEALIANGSAHVRR